jgi:Leucine-rich repeat (LRR) protein
MQSPPHALLVSDVVQNVIEFIADRPSALLACRGVSWRWHDCTGDAVAFLNDKCATKLHFPEGFADQHQRTHEACQVLCLSDRLEELHADTSLQRPDRRETSCQLMRVLRSCTVLLTLTLRHRLYLQWRCSPTTFGRYCAELNVPSVTLCLDQAPITDEDMLDLQQMQSLKGLSLRGCVGTQLARAFLCPHLTFLDLSSTRVKDDEIASFAAAGCVSQLKSLALNETTVDGEASALRSFTALTSLELSQTQIDSGVVSTLTPTLRKLNLSSCRNVTNLAALSHLTALEELCVSFTDIVDVDCLSSLSRLTDLNVNYCKKLASVPCGRSCPALRELSAMCVPWTSIDSLGTISTLEKLVLDDCDHITTLTPLQHCTALRQLSVKMRSLGSDQATSSIDDSGILGLERAVTLEELVLDGCRRIRSVSFLASLPALTKLVLARTSVDDLGILGLELIPTLQTLTLSGTAVTNVTHLSGCRALTALDLSDTNITDDGIHGLETIPTLTTLDARSCPHLCSVGSLGLCPALRELTLKKCSISDEGIRGLERSGTLQRLNLSYNERLRSVTCVAGGCPRLQMLDLYYTAVDDAGIEGLEGLPSLRSLYVALCPLMNPIPLLQSKSLDNLVIPMMERAVMEQLGNTDNLSHAFSVRTISRHPDPPFLHLKRCEL